MLGFQAVIELPDGARLVIEALKPEWMTPCAELLTTSFVATASNVAPYGRFVRRRIGVYLEEHAGLPPKALVLTAVVERVGGTSDGSSTSCSSSKSDSRSDSRSDGSSSSSTGAVLVGTAEVSLDPSTRSSYPTLNPPAAGAYVCNCAVDAGWRRRGVATHLMCALEAVAADAGEQYAYLHLRMRDNGEAGALYRSMGYEEFKADGWWVALLGMERRWLMRKALRGGAKSPTAPDSLLL